MANESEIMRAMTVGIKFGGAKQQQRKDDNGKVKTKARKKAYKTGAHNSDAARHKEEIRQRVKNRASQRKGR